MLLPRFATQILIPSKATPNGLPPAVKLPRLAPSLARSLVTVLLPDLSPRYWLRQGDAKRGVPHAEVAELLAPSPARSLVTVLLLP